MKRENTGCAAVLGAISAEAVAGHIGTLEGVRHPLAAPEALEAAADYLAQTLSDLGYQVEEQTFPEHGRLFRNVMASLPGLTRPEERILVVAHYDTVANSPGADDNASGVAGVLELARVFAGCRLERTVQFVGVCLEENQIVGDRSTGLQGSKALAALAHREGWQIAGVLVLESIGFAGPDLVQTLPPGIPFEVSKVGDFIAVITNETSLALAQSFADSVGRYVIELPHAVLPVPGNGELLPDTRRSDHAPFWDLGYPAIMLTDTTNFRSPHYHQPSDTLDTLNLAFATAVVRATAGTICRLGGLQEG